MSKSEQTRQYIIEKTAPVFNKKGFAGTSLSDLESATGLTKGSIYGNFKNKDEVALAAFDYNMDKVIGQLQRELQTKDSSLEKLLVFVDFYNDHYYQEAIKVGCPIVNMGPEADDTHPKLHARINEVVRKWKKSLEKIIREGKDRGEIKLNVEEEKYAVLMISLTEGGIMMAKLTGNPIYFDHCNEQVRKLIFKELKK